MKKITIDELYNNQQRFINNIIQKKYLINNEKTFDDLINNRFLKFFGDNYRKEYDEFTNKEDFLKKIKDILINKRFLPGGSILFGIGNNAFNSSLSNCYVDKIKGDSLEDIIDCCKRMARIYSYRGGVGVSISILRPKNTTVNNAAITSTGSVSFMPLLSQITETIGQSGRRGALLISMDDFHPDLLDFIKSKSHPEEVFQKDSLNNKLPDVNYANISVRLSDKFFECLEKDEDWEFIFPDIDADKMKYNKEWDGDINKWIKNGGKIKVHNKIKARELLNIIAENALLTGDPGIIFWDTARKYSTSEFDERTKIEGNNPCVSGDTLLLTKNGFEKIENLIDKETEIWNGFNWVTIEPKITGYNQKLLEIEFNNGIKLKCTGYHNFLLNNGDVKSAKELNINDKLIKFEYPILNGNIELLYPYTQGFYSGDGHFDKNRNRKMIWLYKEKKKIANCLGQYEINDELYYNQNFILDNNKKRMCVVFNKEISDILLEKEFVPLNNYTINTKLKWLAGIIDSDGTLNDKWGSIAISANNKEFLSNIQLLLMTLGCYSNIKLSMKERIKLMPFNQFTKKEYRCQDNYRLLIPSSQVKKLYELGLRTKRVSLQGKNNKRNKIKNIRVTNIKEIGIADKVYCFNEPKKHLGMFNGITTKQCSEQTLPAFSSCFLGSFVLHKYINNPFSDKPEFLYDLFINDIKYIVAMMDIIADENIKRHPLEEQKEMSAYERRMGLGITGLADMLAMMNLKYDSKEALDFIEKIMKLKMQYEWQMSVKLAKLIGPCPALEPELKRDKFIEQEFFKRHPDVFDRRFVEDVIQYGCRNISLSSVAPTGSLSIIADNCTSGIEPLFALQYERRSRLSEPEIIFHYPLIKWIKENKNNPNISDKLKKYIELDEWSNINKKEILNDFNYIESRSLNYEKRIEIQSVIQKYIDTAISSTINLPSTTKKEDIYNIYQKAFYNRLKGITVFVDGAKEGILKEIKEKPKKEEIPNTDNIKNKPIQNTGYEIELLDEELAKRLRCNYKGVKLYINITIDEFTGMPLEMFVSIPYEIGINGNGEFSPQLYLERKGEIDALMRLISVCLRYGVPVDEIFKQLKKSSYSVVSLPAIINRVLSKFLKNEDGDEEEPQQYFSDIECPHCKQKTVTIEGGCVICKSCGYSKCG